MWLLLFQDRGAAFLASLAVGGLIGLIYDVFRVIRVIYTGGRIKLFMEDVVFCVMASLVFTVFMFNATMGVIRMFAAIGALFGFFAYRFSVGLLTVPVAKWLKSKLTAPLKWVLRCMRTRLDSVSDYVSALIQSKRAARLASNGFGMHRT